MEPNAKYELRPDNVADGWQEKLAVAGFKYDGHVTNGSLAETLKVVDKLFEVALAEEVRIDRLNRGLSEDDPMDDRQNIAQVPVYFKLGAVEFAAWGDHLLIREDEFRSGYECPECKGTGEMQCPGCDGRGNYMKGDVDFKCSYCAGKGKVSCNQCAGKGGLLVVPDQAQRRPTTGEIVSAGEECKYFKPGDSVLYSSFCGFLIELQTSEGPVALRIIHESEVLSRVRGHLDYRNVKDRHLAVGG